MPTDPLIASLAELRQLLETQLRLLGTIEHAVATLPALPADHHASRLVDLHVELHQVSREGDRVSAAIERARQALDDRQT